MAEGVVFSFMEEILKKVDLLAAQEVALWCGVKDQLCKFEQTFTRIKAVIQDAEEQAQKQNHQFKDWFKKLREAVNDAENLLDDFSTQVLRRQLMSGNGVSREVCVFFSKSNQFVYDLRLAHKVKALRERLDDIEAVSKNFNFRVRDGEEASLATVREQTISSEPEVIVGREHDKRVVKSFLLNHDNHNSVSAISIIGIDGLGKTTLAQHIFNDEQVNEHFDVKLWVSVSGNLELTTILSGVVGINFVGLESLKRELEKQFAKKKCLLVLDDVWDGLDLHQWEFLKKLLPYYTKGIKIMTTTHASKILTNTQITSHVLKGLSVDESWDLFRRKAFPQGQESDNVDEEIRQEIIKRCCGVPLVIKAIASLMFLKDRAQWLSFITNELPVSIRDDNIIQTLKLSYDALPSFMKHCFAYCSLFPKGHKIDVKLLIRLWIAQGFVNSSNSGGGSLEIAGLRSFENLLWRSFFHEVEKDDSGNIKSCNMHDLMHDLATHVARFESTMVDKGGNRISDLTRHVSFDMELYGSQKIPIPLPCAKRLRTLIFLQGCQSDEGVRESICRDFRHLRVLLLCHFRIQKVSPLIEKLKHLKYLDLSNNEMEALPNSITNLVNLQVLKLNRCRKLKILPRDINKLINLRHLDIGRSLDNDLCYRLEYMPRGIGQLTCLQTLSCFVVAKNSHKSKMVGGLNELSRLNELKGSLEIRVLGYERKYCISEFEGAKLIDKQYLQSLTIRWNVLEDGNDSALDLYDKILQSLQPNLNLQELEVRGYRGMRFPSWLSSLSNLARIHLVYCRRLEHIPPLEGIPSLEELSFIYLDNLEYIDNEGVGGEGVTTFFPSLKKLNIQYCHNLKGWWKNSSDESESYFPCLSSLRIKGCPLLTSMPLFPNLDRDLELWNSSSIPLEQTMDMKSPVSASSSFIHLLSNLKTLRGGKGCGTYPNLKLIPKVTIGRYYIQKDGCYVENERLMHYS